MIKPITTHLTHSFVWGRLYKNLQMRVLILLKSFLCSMCVNLNQAFLLIFSGTPRCILQKTLPRTGWFVFKINTFYFILILNICSCSIKFWNMIMSSVFVLFLRWYIRHSTALNVITFFLIKIESVKSGNLVLSSLYSFCWKHGFNNLWVTNLLITPQYKVTNIQ